MVPAAHLSMTRIMEASNEMTKRETSTKVSAVAADWAARVDGAPLEANDQVALDRWLAADSRHLGAYARARAVLYHAGRARAFGPDFDPNSYLKEHGGKAAGADEEAPPLAMRRRTFLLGGGATFVAGTAIALGVSWQAAAQVYTTKRGEIRLIPLEDGSAVTLNTASSMRVAFSRQLRHVDLVEGEAIFDVARDPVRPFVVVAGDTRVRASDTSFTMRHLSDAPVQVTVRRGALEIDHGAGSGARRTITANMRAVSPDDGGQVTTSQTTPTEIAQELSWREGMLSFEDVPLAQAIKEFGRYSDTEIAFADPEIGNETVTGLFAASNPAGFARSVALSLGLETQVKGRRIILLHNSQQG